MPPGKTNGLVKSEKGDAMMQLLDSTESDVEWLNLPPIKGKKPKKRKLSKQRDTGTVCCNFWSFLKAFLLVTIVGAVALLSVVTIWLSAQLDDVREQLHQGAISLISLEQWQKNNNVAPA